MLPIESFTVVLDGEEWRFIISELKQQEAWYQHRANDALWKEKQSLAEELAIKMARCERMALKISGQIERQKEQ